MKKNYTDLLAALNVAGAHPGSFKHTQFMLKTLDINNQSKVLDVGCGTGQTIAYIAEKFRCTVYGIDHHEEMVLKAKSRIAGIAVPPRVLLGRIEKLPFEDNSFDIILSESVTAFTQIQSALKEYHRVLKNDGMLIMNELTKIDLLEPEEETNFKEFYGFSELLKEREWKKRIAEAGFKHINSKRIPTHSEAPGEVYSIEKLDRDYNDLLMNHQLLTEKFASKIAAYLYICHRST
ncbi:class I SAM-dependent methyltransferase [Virgibacillus senegalensis]|uniref:class I SAM-dependent methyltransferase n=1 Tax=Virgibacillus senegalensis TaxID=1499679 RepID=UPI00069E9A3D|nr:class I SAM-dependent methyltransferase [Virgibacillus senegalensis]